MPIADLPLAHLRDYRPDVNEPADFAEFWDRTLTEARTHDLGVQMDKVDTALRLIDVYDLTFAGYGGHPIRAWLRLPHGATAPLPAVVEFLGYGGGRGLAHEGLTYAAAGYAHLVMDSRGQGSSWGSGGDTPDPVGSGPAFPGHMTRGITDPHDYYFRRLYVDAVRAVEAMAALPQVDSSRIAVTGGSQGGALSTVVAALSDQIVTAVIDVPFLSHFSRALELSDTKPYLEITAFLAVHRDLVDIALHTLSYFDGVNFARRARVPALYSVALMDTTCPPSTVFASYNSYRGTKEITVYPFNDHEGGGEYHMAARLEWLRRHLT